MKAAIVVLVIAGIVTGVVLVLGSTLAPAKFDRRSAGVTGPLALGAVSRAEEPIQLWREPRGTITREDRESLLVGTLSKGDVFEVLNHVPNDILWVEVRSTVNPELRGWLRSPPDEPVRASRLKK
jgi:hypothetical protein